MINSDNAIFTEIEALYNTGAPISVILQWFFNKSKKQAKINQCNRTISGAGGGTHIRVEECFVQLQIGKKTFRGRVIVIKNLTRDYI